MASSKGAASAKPRKKKVPEEQKLRAFPRPLPPFRSGDPGLDAVLRPLLARAEPGAERALDLEHARARLLHSPRPSDAEALVALLNDDALDLGADSDEPPGRSREARDGAARVEHAREARLEYVGLLVAAACLHDLGQSRVAEILAGPHRAAIKERAALQCVATAAPLSGPLEAALRSVLDRPPAEPSPEERNLLSSAARALLRHLAPQRASEALRAHLTDEAIAQPGGLARAQMILTDLDIERLGTGFRPALRSLLRHGQLCSFACDLLAALPPDTGDAVAAADVLGEQLAQSTLPDGYLIWLLARAPHATAAPVLLQLLDASYDPDWPVITDGLRRLDDASAAEPLLRWIERHRKLTARQSSWEGYEAARSLARHLARAR